MAMTPMATATAKPPKNDPASNCRPEPRGVAVVAAVVGDGVAVVMFPSVGRQHTTDTHSQKLSPTLRVKFTSMFTRDSTGTGMVSAGTTSLRSGLRTFFVLAPDHAKHFFAR